MGATGSGEYLVALGLVLIALQDRCCPEWIPAASLGVAPLCL